MLETDIDGMAIVPRDTVRTSVTGLQVSLSFSVILLALAPYFTRISTLGKCHETQSEAKTKFLGLQVFDILSISELSIHRRRRRGRRRRSSSRQLLPRILLLRCEGIVPAHQHTAHHIEHRITLAWDLDAKVHLSDLL